MDRIEELKLQKKEIEKELKILTEREKNCGIVKINRESFGLSKGGERYYLSVFVKNRGRWQKIMYGESRKEVIEQISELIKDLETIYERINGEKLP